MKKYIVNGTLIDGTGRPAQKLAWMEMDGGRISAIAAGEQAPPLPPGASVTIDAAGKTVMPGLTDAHCHISYGVARGIEEQDLFGSPEYRAIRGVYHARKVLQSGVTSFSDPGGSWYVGVAVRDAIKGGLFPGPRISAAARYLSNHAALTDYFPSWVGSPRSGVGAMTETASQMLAEVRDQVKNGVDFIKIAASGESATLTPGGGSVPAFRADELKLIVDEAHRLGRRVTAHARAGQSVSDCIEAGIDWIQHADFMDQACADRLADAGIPCCPALTFVANVAEWGHIAGCSQGRIDRFRRDLDLAVKNLEYGWRNGVTMMCGTDSGFAVTPYGEWHARELELFVSHLGMSPLQAITCGTRNAAFTVDPENLGTLEVGKFADLLVIDGDPLQDIRILQDSRRLCAVILGGEMTDMTPTPEMHRWPWERSLAISERELYRETVASASVTRAAAA
ncbi:metal-dependent hydrolase family protein [Xenophilus azovorans]|uniref:metal-dependent hydrolase family protein n=1 Tax=Xenophilus azovorans TaxID=151755 RepID=UPI0006896FE2|nr:amidohydrolase family protein [Xenophilus azovorans]